MAEWQAEAQEIILKCNDLEEWKQQQLVVESEWDVQAVGKALNIPIGASIRKGILPAVERLKKVVDAVDDVLVINWITVNNDDYRKALSDLVFFCIQIENDPAVSETAIARQKELTRLRDALQGLLDLGRKDTSNPKYDGFYASATAALNKEV